MSRKCEVIRTPSVYAPWVWSAAERTADGMLTALLQLQLTRASPEIEFDGSNCFGPRGPKGAGKVEAPVPKSRRRSRDRVDNNRSSNGITSEITTRCRLETSGDEWGRAGEAGQRRGCSLTQD